MFSMHLTASASASARLESGWDNATADYQLAARGSTMWHQGILPQTRARNRKKGRKADTEIHLHTHTNTHTLPAFLSPAHTHMVASEGLTGTQTQAVLLSFKGRYTPIRPLYRHKKNTNSLSLSVCLYLSHTHARARAHVHSFPFRLLIT